MALTINTNLASLNAQRNLGTSQMQLNSALQRLSSGSRVNSAKDDAAGLAIAERMTSQIRGTTVAIRNANDGISLAQTAEGALSSMSDMMQRMRELATQASNATSSSDLTSLNTEYQDLATELTRTLNATTFNGKAVLAADAGTLTFQVGAGTSADNRIDITTTDLTGDATVTAVTGGDLTSAANARTAMTNIDTALGTLNTQRANLGSVQNRFQFAIDNLQISGENIQSARSRIMDTDFATETANLTKAQILQQAGTAMLAQANSAPNYVLSLLR